MGDKFVPDPYHEKRKSGEFDFNKLTKEEKKAEYKRDEIREENRDHRQYMRMTLMENIFSIKNKDNSLVIDCLRNMILDYLEVNKVSMPKLYDICAHLVSTKATTYLSQKQIKNYYIDAVSNLSKNDVAKLPGKVSRKNIYGNKANGFTFYLIREAYQILSQIDADRPDALERLYNYLGISETDYQSMIDNNLAPNKKLADLLTPFKYPASLFKGDKPAEYDISDDIRNYYKEYYLNGDYDLFNNALTVYLCYKISSNNIGLVMPTMKYIKCGKL